MASISRQPDDTPQTDPIHSPEAGRADVPPSGTSTAPPPSLDAVNYGEDVDLGYWLMCMDDAERAERDFRQRGREVVEIYRNARAAAKGAKKFTPGSTFNILYANTEVLLGAIYQKPPQPVVKSRFSAAKKPQLLPGLTPPMMAGGLGLPPSPEAAMVPPVGVPPPFDAAALGSPLGGIAGEPAIGAPAPIPAASAGPDVTASPVPPDLLPPQGAPPVGAEAIQPPVASPPLAGPALGGMPPPEIVPPQGLPLGGSRPEQRDIETAAAVIEKALEIVVDDEHSHEAVKTSIKDVLLPGRGTCRVRWNPQMQTNTLPGGPLPDGTTPTEEVKVWETVDDEYVYWEDALFDPVRQSKDCDWIGFRHLFTEQSLRAEFAGNPKFDAMDAAGRLSEWLIWTDEAAAKHAVGGGSAMKSAQKLGGHRKKAMVWEVWDRITRTIIWMIRDGDGIILRVDPDAMQLQGFFPCPVPMLAVTTSDTRIPATYYDLYAKLAEDLDETSVRISQLTKKIKVRGAYNAANKDIADILTADDGKMLGVAGVDMLNGGLQNHVWLVPILEWIQ